MGFPKLWAKGNDGNRGFVFSHVKTVYYNWASKILLKTKLDEMDAFIDAKIAKAMMSSQQVNDANRVPTSALAYAMGNDIAQNAEEISTLKSHTLKEYWKLTGGTPIPNGADLKSPEYLIPGNYCSGDNDSVATLKNCPVNSAFVLKVDHSVEGKTYPRQTFITYKNEWIARTYSSSIGSWFEDCSYALKGDFVIKKGIPTSQYGTVQSNSYVRRSGNILSFRIGLDITKDYTEWRDAIAKIPPELARGNEYTLFSTALQGTYKSSVQGTVLNGDQVQLGKSFKIGDIAQFQFTVILG